MSYEGQKGIIQKEIQTTNCKEIKPQIKPQIASFV